MIETLSRHQATEDQERTVPFSGLGVRLDKAAAHARLLSLDEAKPDVESTSRRFDELPFVVSGFVRMTMLGRETRGR